MEVIAVKEAKEYVAANYPNDPLLKRIVLNLLDQLPKTQAAEVVCGRWITVSHKEARICTVCGSDEPYKFADGECDVYDFCPHCGARMRGGK